MHLTLRLCETVEMVAFTEGVLILVFVFVLGKSLLLGGQSLLIVGIFNTAFSIFSTSDFDVVIAQY